LFKDDKEFKLNGGTYFDEKDDKNPSISTYPTVS
jgi:hypothetical protein